MPPQKLFIKTYGCQANINDSEIILRQFEKKGYEIADNENKADIIFINSCTVKNKTQSKILHYINKYYGKKKIIIGGCLVKTNNLKKQFPLVEIADTIKLKRLGVELVRKDKNIAIIQISKGCLNECTYCATRIAKGRLESYPISKIKKELERAVNEECKIIYLTSQDNGCYGFDIKTNLAKLLKELVKVEGNYKVRIGMANPWHIAKFFDSLIEVFKSDKIIKFLHIPIQSGSDKILKNMKRAGKVEDFKKIVNKFRRKFPRRKFSDSTIATDIIIGYPSETEEEFEKTIELIKEIKPEVLNISVFSSRGGTEASRLKQLPSEVIKKRSKRLSEIYRKYKKN